MAFSTTKIGIFNQIGGIGIIYNFSKTHLETLSTKQHS